MKTVALLTDFGTKDGFVGSMKGVILNINPEINIVDISHEVESFDILEGSLIIYAIYKYFPKGTIFVSVVDPGVGTERKPIVVKTKDYTFLAPDNGILTLALKDQKVEKIVEIKNEKYILKADTNTFHGRDIFSPVAAYISKGVDLSEVGPEVEDFIKLNFPTVYKEKDFYVAKIIKFDKFGNAITNIERLPENFEIEYKNFTITKISKNFLEGDKNKPNLIKGSFGFYELFVPKNSFKDKFSAKEMEKIILKIK